MTLWRTRYVMGSSNPEVCAVVIDRVHFARIDETAIGDVADESVVLPTIPERLDDVGEFGGARIALAMVDRSIAAEISGRRRIGYLCRLRLC